MLEDKSNELREGDLFAYLQGEAPQWVVDIIEASEAYQAELKELGTMDALLGYTMYRASCPDMDTLLDFQAGFLEMSQLRQVQRHVDGCTHCQTELAGMDTAMAALAPKTATAVESTAVHEETTAVSLSEKARAMGKRLLKALLMAPPAQPAMALRGERQEDMYEAGTYQLMLVKEPPLAGDNIWQLEGQITREDDPFIELSGSVQLLRQGETAASSAAAREVVAEDEVDEFGCFALADVKSGTYTLHINLAKEIVEVSEVLLG